jgi:acyl-coenzyme A synthetase/AMP-(fatty) acid ligase
MLRYWNLPEATAEKLRTHEDGTRTLFTGDLFLRDPDGWLSFVARKDDIIKTRGEKVSPREVENVLHALPGVAQAAVIGIDDALLGAVVKAFLVKTAGATLDEKTVLRHCAAELEDFAVPKRVVFLDEMPQTANAKIDKMALKELREGSP